MRRNKDDREMFFDNQAYFSTPMPGMPFSSNKDRHEKIGQGTIGLDAIVRIINHPKLKDLPFYLETPNELEGYKEEIELLKSKRQN